MKKNSNIIHKILLSMIGLLSAVLLILLVPAGYRLITDKIQEKEWKVRNVEVQSELEIVQLKLQELSSDSQALQQFLEETEASAKKKEQEQKDQQKEQQNDKPKVSDNKAQEQISQTEGEAVETMGRVEGDAILIEEPEPVVIPDQKEASGKEDAGFDTDSADLIESISQNAISTEEANALFETVSQNAAADKKAEEEARKAAEKAEQERLESISQNAVSQEEANQVLDTVSQNLAPANDPKEEEQTDTISQNAVSDVQPSMGEETISSNAAANQVTEPTEESVSANTIVDGQAIPFRYISEETSLTEKRALKSSYEETTEANEADRQVIASNTIDFSQMKIACLGDSLTAASKNSGSESSSDLSYPAVLKEQLNLKEVYNLGIGGSSIGRYWDKPFVDRYTEIPEDADIILVMGGTNDGFAASAKELGSLEERKKRTFYGDTDELMRGLKERYPKAEIIFVTPPSNVLHDYLMSQRDYLLPQLNYVDAIKQLAAEYDISVIDLYNSNILDTHDGKIITEYMPDGVHGNQAGCQILGVHFASELIQFMQEKQAYEQSAGESAEAVNMGNVTAGSSVSENRTELDDSSINGNSEEAGGGDQNGNGLGTANDSVEETTPASDKQNDRLSDQKKEVYDGEAIIIE